MATTVADADVLITADVSKFASDLKKKIDPIVRAINATLDVLADATRFNDTIDRTIREADRRTATIAVNADTTALKSEIVAAQRDIDGREATIHAKVEVDRDLDKIKGSFTKKFSSLGDDSGKAFSSAATSSISSGLKPLTTIIPESLANPVIIGAAAIVAALVAIPAAALVAATALTGLGLGFLGLGALALKGNTEVSGAFTDMKNQIVKTFTDAAQPLVEPLVKAFGIIGDAVEKIGPQLQKAFKGLAPTLEELAKGFAGFIENVTPGLTDALVAAAPLLNELAKQLPGLGTALGDFFKIIGLAGPDSVDALKVAFGLLKLALFAVAFTILGLTIAFGALVDAMRFVVDIANQLFTAITGLDFGTTAELIKQFVTGSITAIGDFINQTKAFLGELPIVFSTFFSQAINTAINLVTIGFNTLVALATGIPSRIFGAISSLPSVIFNVFFNAFSLASGVVRNGISNIVNTLRGLAGQVVGALSGLASSAFNSGKSIITNLINGLLSRISDLRSAASKVVSTISKLLPHSPAEEGPFSGKGAPELSGKAISRDVAKGIESGESALGRAAQGAVNSIKDQFNQINPAATGLGMQTVAGIGSTTTSNNRTFSPIINVTVQGGGDGTETADAIVRRLLAVGV